MVFPQGFEVRLIHDCGERLRIIHKSTGMTLDDFAALLGLGRNSIWNLEHGYPYDKPYLPRASTRKLMLDKLHEQEAMLRPAARQALHELEELFTQIDLYEHKKRRQAHRRGSPVPLGTPPILTGAGYMVWVIWIGTGEHNTNEQSTIDEPGER